MISDAHDPYGKSIAPLRCAKIEGFTDETLQDSREVRLPQVISKPYDPRCDEHEAGNAENVNPQTVRVKE
jgi:hypothetical protein